MSSSNGKRKGVEAEAEEKEKEEVAKRKEKKRKIRAERNIKAAEEVLKKNATLQTKKCKICEQTLPAENFAAKQLLKQKAACVECSKVRAETNASTPRERLKKMTKREKLEAAIERRNQTKERNKEKKQQQQQQQMDDENDEASDEIASRSMYCGGIPFHKLEDDIKYAFLDEGLEVESVDFMVFPDSGRFRGIAILVFKCVSDRDKALEFDGEDWEGFSLVCKPYKKAKKKSNGTQRSSHHEEEVKKIDGQRVAFVANLDYSAVTEDLLRQTFEQGSKTKEIRMGLDKETKDFKGFAHVEFFTDEDLECALKLNGSELLGRKMKVTYATERRKKNDASSSSNPKSKRSKKIRKS